MQQLCKLNTLEYNVAIKTLLDCFVPFLHDVSELLAKIIALFDEFTQFVIPRVAL